MKNFDEVKIIFNIRDEDKKIISEIERRLKDIIIDKEQQKMNLKTKSRVRSVYSSLAIEANSLSLESMESIVDKKIVLGDRKEIQEVKNANELYENINNYDYKSEEDFLNAHSLMMKYFDEDNGYYRNHGEGVKRGDKIIYRAPESILVPSLMKTLFKFLSNNEIHPLVLASVFHYYFVYIHPFSDGNGRMARFWMSLILTKWNSKFEYIPIEEELYLNQEEYYSAIDKCHTNGNANVFISFILKCINNILDKTTQETTQENYNLNNNQRRIIELMKQDSFITRNEIASKLDITSDGVKYNIAKLISLGLIKREGSTKSGKWMVRGNNDE